jgi:hypothetical protein
MAARGPRRCDAVAKPSTPGLRSAPQQRAWNRHAFPDLKEPDMPSTFIAGPKPVKPAEIQQIAVKYDVKGDGLNNRLVATGSNKAVDFVIVDKANNAVNSQTIQGRPGAAIRDILVGVAQANSAELASFGTNAPAGLRANVNPSYPYAMMPLNPKAGEWYITIDRSGKSADQVLRGRLDDQLPQSIKDVLKAAQEIANEVL